MIVRRDADLILALVGTAGLIAIVVALPGADGARVALGLPFVLLAPGYALAAALYPCRGDLAAAERMLLSVGLSLAVVPLLGLGLDFLSAGVRLETFLASIALVIVLSTAAAAVRRRLAPAGEAYGLDLSLPPRRRWEAALRVVLPALALAPLGLAVYFAAASGGGDEPYSEFYVLAEDGQAAGYPRALTAGEPVALKLGVVNHEGIETEYRIDLTFGGRPLRYVEGLVLGEGERWESTVYLTAGGARHHQRADLALFRAGDAQPYRNLFLTMDVRPGRPLGPPQPAGVALAAFQAPRGEPAAEDEPLLPAVHIVSPGEYLSLIAATYGVPLDDVIGANDLPDPNVIHPDQEIVVPSREE